MCSNGEEKSLEMKFLKLHFYEIKCDIGLFFVFLK